MLLGLMVLDKTIFRFENLPFWASHSVGLNNHSIDIGNGLWLGTGVFLTLRLILHTHQGSASIVLSNHIWSTCALHVWGG